MRWARKTSSLTCAAAAALASGRAMLPPGPGACGECAIPPLRPACSSAFFSPCTGLGEGALEWPWVPGAWPPPPHPKVAFLCLHLGPSRGQGIPKAPQASAPQGLPDVCPLWGEEMGVRREKEGASLQPPREGEDLEGLLQRKAPTSTPYFPSKAEHG